MSVLEIRPHQWRTRGENYGADFFPFVDGQPRHDIDCEMCQKYRGEGSDCAQLAEHGVDDLLYPFCGQICGHFTSSASLESGSALRSKPDGGEFR